MEVKYVLFAEKKIENSSFTKIEERICFCQKLTTAQEIAACEKVIRNDENIKINCYDYQDNLVFSI